MKNQFTSSHSTKHQPPHYMDTENWLLCSQDPQFVLTLSQLNLLHAFPTQLRYLHFYAAIRQTIYAQPLISFINTMFDADISKTCKQS